MRDIYHGNEPPQGVRQGVPWEYRGILHNDQSNGTASKRVPGIIFIKTAMLGITDTEVLKNTFNS